MVKLLEDQNVALQNINNIKNNVTSKFKEKMWCEKNVKAKRKLRYYKEVKLYSRKSKISLCFN